MPSYATATGRFIDPAGAPLAGSILFTPEATAVLLTEPGTDPATVLPEPVEAQLDTTGRITASLLAPEDGVTNPTGWTWRVTPKLVRNGNTVRYQSWSLATTPGATLDLAREAPVPSTEGTGVTRGASTYETWLSLGNTGTEADFINSIAVDVDLTAYVTDDELTTALTPYATTQALTDGLATKANAADVVYTVNGTAPDDTGNVTVETSGGGSVQDTGWRQVSLINGATGILKIRRLANLVYFNFEGVNTTGSTSPIIYKIPIGFRQEADVRDMIVDWGPKTMIYFALAVFDECHVQTGIGSARGLRFTFTKDAWPTVLPGTPA